MAYAPPLPKRKPLASSSVAEVELQEIEPEYNSHFMSAGRPASSFSGHSCYFPQSTAQDPQYKSAGLNDYDYLLRKDAVTQPVGGADAG